MLEEILKTIVGEKKKEGMRRPLILNSLREYLQYLVLSFLYNSPDFKKLVFKGGSCLRICFDLPRLSEDLDFDGKVDLLKLESFLKEKIKKAGFNNLETKIQGKGRLYLKFPILKRLELVQKGESDKLYVKIEIGKDKLANGQFSLTPISQKGFNFLLYHYDLPSLFSGKINAILERLWFKGKKNEVDIKGRDFYDLWWFLQKEIMPNFSSLALSAGIKNEKELKKALLERFKMVTPYKLAFDLQNFLSDTEFVNDFAKNYNEIITLLLFKKERG